MGNFTAPEGLPKMSTRLGWASFFIALFIFKENGNHKNNMLDISASKVNYIGISTVYVLLSTVCLFLRLH